MPKILLECVAVTKAAGGGYRAEFLAVFPSSNYPPGFDEPVVAVTPMPAVPGRFYELTLCGIFNSNHGDGGESRKCVDSVLLFTTPLTLEAISLEQEVECERARKS